MYAPLVFCRRTAVLWSHQLRASHGSVSEPGKTPLMPAKTILVRPVKAFTATDWLIIGP